MNPSPPFQIPGEMLHAMKTRPESEWKGLFRDLIREKSEQLSACEGTESLLKLQAGVRALQELEQFFLSEMRR